MGPENLRDVKEGCQVEWSGTLVKSVRQMTPPMKVCNILGVREGGSEREGLLLLLLPPPLRGTFFHTHTTPPSLPQSLICSPAESAERAEIQYFIAL